MPGHANRHRTGGSPFGDRGTGTGDLFRSAQGSRLLKETLSEKYTIREVPLYRIETEPTTTFRYSIVINMPCLRSGKKCDIRTAGYDHMGYRVAQFSVGHNRQGIDVSALVA